MLQSKQVAARKPLPEPTSAVHPVEVYGEILQPAGGFLLNQVIEMCGIPAGTVPTAYKIVCDDLDSATGITFTAGKMSGLYGSVDDARTIGTDFSGSSTIGQTGGIINTPKEAPLLYKQQDHDVGVGIKITAAPTTPIVGARVRMYITCVQGDQLLT